MAADQEKQNQKPAERPQRASELSMAEKLIEFIQKNRKLLFTGFIVIAVALIGSIVGITVQDRARLNAFTRLDEFVQRHQNLTAYIGSQELEALLRQGEVTALLEELAVFAARNSGLPAALAHTLRAEIFEVQERWPLAERAWVAAADAAPRIYLTPISLFNAAAAAEQHGDLESALELYTRVLEHEGASLIRAQFSIGRLHEEKNNREAALAAWQDLLSRWPHVPFYADLAQSRIIVLSD